MSIQAQHVGISGRLVLNSRCFPGECKRTVLLVSSRLGGGTYHDGWERFFRRLFRVMGVSPRFVRLTRRGGGLASPALQVLTEHGPVLFRPFMRGDREDYDWRAIRAAIRLSRWLWASLRRRPGWKSNMDTRWSMRASVRRTPEERKRAGDYRELAFREAWPARLEDYEGTSSR